MNFTMFLNRILKSHTIGYSSSFSAPINSQLIYVMQPSDCFVYFIQTSNNLASPVDCVTEA